MNPSTIRNDFPIFSSSSQETNNLVYLDNAATTQKPNIVINSITNFYQNSYATVHRAIYPIGEHATEMYELARKKVARFINAAHASEIIFTKGTTESINFVAQAWAIEHLKSGDEIVLTQAEHHANLLPWQRVAEKTGARLVFIPIDKQTYTVINPTDYITPKTRLLAITIDSNVVGDIWDLANNNQLHNVIAAARHHNARILIDAAQSVLHKKLDVQELNADFVVFSGHKMLAPTGVGVLYCRQELHDAVNPYQVGGSMVWEVSYEKAVWAKSPQKFEAGTPPIAQVIGLGAAIDYIDSTIDFNSLAKQEALLTSHIINGLRTIPNLHIAGNIQRLRQSGHLVSFAIKGLHAHDIAGYLGEHNIAIRAGHHCTQPFVTYLGHQSLLRVSIAPYTTEDDVTRFLQMLHQSIASLHTVVF